METIFHYHLISSDESTNKIKDINKASDSSPSGARQLCCVDTETESFELVETQEQVEKKIKILEAETKTETKTESRNTLGYSG